MFIIKRIAFTRVVVPVILFFLLIDQYSSAKVTYNIRSYGAKANDRFDSKNAFLKAWNLACASTKPAIIYVPAGRYLIASAITFSGQACKSKAIRFNIDGTLVAPSSYNAIGNAQVWIKFNRVNHVTISGGTLDAQGAPLWACKSSGKTCQQGATTRGVYHSENIVISRLRSINNQMFHILLYACNNARLHGLSIIAPDLSPNTDGIHLISSTGVTITSSKIATGDDCISIGPGNSNLWIEKVVCGPGHGISIGSLGWELHEPGVQNVTVKSTKFVGTQNGLRIKSWARRSNGFVKDVVFQHSTMVNVQNPIIIDANYCPHNKNCPDYVSGVKISNVMYEDIRGTSATPVAVTFDCIKGKPCSGIRLKALTLDMGLTQQPLLAPMLEEPGVQNVTIKSTKFIGTQNGLRIKSWARRSIRLVKDVVFQHSTMVNVQNPIIIDANYCPHNKSCPEHVSGVKISNVIYEDMRGTSTTPVAVTFDCIKGKPCSAIRLKDVSLRYGTHPATSSCSHVGGSASGILGFINCL